MVLKEMIRDILLEDKNFQKDTLRIGIMDLLNVKFVVSRLKKLAHKLRIVKNVIITKFLNLIEREIKNVKIDIENIIGNTITERKKIILNTKRKISYVLMRIIISEMKFLKGQIINVKNVVVAKNYNFIIKDTHMILKILRHYVENVTTKLDISLWESGG